MKSWLNLLGGLLVWGAHFFVVYGIASLLPGRPEARWLVLLATAIGLVALAWLLRGAIRARREMTDDEGRWQSGIAALGAAIALVAVFYQGLPAVIG